jgi:hypothetical protein
MTPLCHDGVPNVPDVPGTVTNNIFNANCPEDGQAYHMASMKEPEDRHGCLHLARGEGRGA